MTAPPTQKGEKLPPEPAEDIAMPRKTITQPAAAEAKKPLSEAELLDRIAASDLGWQRRGQGRMVKLWSSETEYRLLTPAERRLLLGLIHAGRVTSYKGVGLWARGIYDLTASERAARSRA